MLKIATFGSCLSRYTANQYIKLFGGQLISSVYHNRSDAFLKRFIDQTWRVGNSIDLSNILLNQGGYTEDSLPENILKNQFIETLGKHRLNKGTPFLDALDGNTIDLLIIDNYMDLSAKLISSSSFDGIFLKLSDIEISSEEITVLDYLSPISAVQSMIKVINFCRLVSPGMRIVFINFPHNTYANSPERIKRSKEYESLFKYRDIDIIPSLNIPDIYQTKERQHFKSGQYCAYAGIIYSLINN